MTVRQYLRSKWRRGEVVCELSIYASETKGKKRGYGSARAAANEGFQRATLDEEFHGLAGEYTMLVGGERLRICAGCKALYVPQGRRVKAVA